MKTVYRLLDHLVGSLTIIRFKHVEDMTVSVLAILIEPALNVTRLIQELGCLLVSRARVGSKEHVMCVLVVLRVPGWNANRCSRRVPPFLIRQQFLLLQ